MAVGRHLECLIPRSSNCNLQKLSHSVPELGGRRHILFLFHKNKDFMNERIIQNGCRTPSWISLFPWQLQILASTHPLWTFLCSFSPNFIFALWYFMILGKYDKRLWLSDAILNILFLKVVKEICKKMSYPGPELRGLRQISSLFHEKWRFYEWKKYSKWLPDAILNIFVRATATDLGKYTSVIDLHM